MESYQFLSSAETGAGLGLGGGAAGFFAPAFLSAGFFAEVESLTARESFLVVAGAAAAAENEPVLAFVESPTPHTSSLRDFCALPESAAGGAPARTALDVSAVSGLGGPATAL